MAYPSSAITVGLLARIEAKPEKVEEVLDFLNRALTLAHEEEFTTIWFALRLGPTTFGIFDAFATDEHRAAHLEGKIADAFMGETARLLAKAPEIVPVDIVAAKLP
ncbi:putative quinol monooxygenase [Streptomyces sp. 1222.5]|uniref:putative quinol monooxygenase n=1 Tax=Streptomyces sp. 1222.5 TaxID=1881026 RepID=UPI003EBFCD5B